MPTALEEVVKIVMEWPETQRLALAGVLLDSSEGETDPESESAWEEEIRRRVREIEEGRDEGIPHEEVIQYLDQRLKV